MMKERNDGVFSLEGSLPRLPARLLNTFLEPMLEHVLGLRTLRQRYRMLPDTSNGHEFTDIVLKELAVDWHIASGDIADIPRSGPAMIIANHPFGGLEGLVVTRVIQSLRKDVKIMANAILGRIPQMRDILIQVDPFAGQGAVRRNYRPMREALNWLSGGGLLIVFPAGEVSHFHLRQRVIKDPPWSPTLARLARKTGTVVTPLFIEGSNSWVFHTLGVLHPRLRTAMLPRELYNKRGIRLHLHIGRPVSPVQLEKKNDQEAIDYLRLRSHMLAPQSVNDDKAAAAPVQTVPVAAAVSSRLLKAEVAFLPSSQCLLQTGETQVHVASAEQIPWCLQEIGRLRELTFRAVGEGTGEASDIDLFDSCYRHLFIWNQATEEIVGAYRLGLVDELTEKYGDKGLYTKTLFKYRQQAILPLANSIELGRSFVRQEYQRSFNPLMLLWKGIAEFIYRHPRYHVLFGPVSISNRYMPLSRRLLVEYLRHASFDTTLARYVRPRSPFRQSPDALYLDAANLPQDLETISDLITQIEKDNKGAPILLKQYLKLGGRLLGFNLDSKFNDALDGLIRVDLMSTPERVLERYMGKDKARIFRDYHLRSESYRQTGG